jgi:hypothetical protein
VVRYHIESLYCICPLILVSLAFISQALCQNIERRSEDNSTVFSRSFCSKIQTINKYAKLGGGGMGNKARWGQSRVLCGYSYRIIDV